MPTDNLLIVHRAYRYKGGEDYFLERILVPTLQGMGISFTLCILPALFGNKRNLVLDFLELIFMVSGLEILRPSYWTVRSQIKKKHYSHLILNNFLPTLSFKIPSMAHGRKMKVFWFIHNARSFCANGLIFNGRAPCVQCLEIGSRQCAINNCHQNRVQSLLYGIIYRWQRPFRRVAPFIDKFLPVSDYAATHIKKIWNIYFSGEPPIVVTIPLVLSASRLPSSQPSGVQKPFYLYMGRVSFEKGADLFAELCKSETGKVFVMAGEGHLRSGIEALQIPNLKILGQVDGAQKEWLLEYCEALIISSRVPENAPMVILESETYKTPVIFPKGGGAEELVQKMGRRSKPFGEGFEMLEAKGEALRPPAFKEALGHLFS